MKSFGSRFQTTVSERFPLPGTMLRMWHIATVVYGMREFMYFLDKGTGKSYIEEVTGGHLELVAEEELWLDLFSFIKQEGLELKIEAGATLSDLFNLYGGKK